MSTIRNVVIDAGRRERTYILNGEERYESLDDSLRGGEYGNHT